MSDFQFREFGQTIQIHGDFDQSIHRRINEAFERTRNQIQINMYGDVEPEKPLTRKQLISHRFRLYVSRVHDAWLVLTGKADLYDGY